MFGLLLSLTPCHCARLVRQNDITSCDHMLQVSCLKIQKLPTIILNIGDREFRISGRHYVQKVSTTMATNYTVHLWFSCFFFFFNILPCASGKFAKQKGNPMVFTRVHTKSRLIFQETVSDICS